MRTLRPVLVLLLVALVSSCAMAAEKGADQPRLVTVVYKNGETLELKTFEVGVEDAGLFGSSFRKLTKLPVTTPKAKLDVPLAKLARIEFLSADKEGKDVTVKLIALDGKILEGKAGHDQKVIWKGTVAFADAEATLDPSAVKEIILGQEAK